MKKFFRWTLLVCCLIFLLVLIFSPYKQNDEVGYRCVASSIEINASTDEVYTYLGNSDNARVWSTYVDHITTLNADRVTDGNVGSIRRCFKQKDEKGIVWDEEVLLVEKNKRRRLSIFNSKNFPIITAGIRTEQIYEKINENKTKLTFTMYVQQDKMGFFPYIKTKLSAYFIAYYFEKNIANIKQEVENGKQ